MSKNEYKKIKEFLDEQNSVFETLEIIIGLEGTKNNSDNASKMYKISGITTRNVSSSNRLEVFENVSKFIEKLNSEIKNSKNTGFKEEDTGWSIFFLIKECIQIFSKKEFGFNYYRGQRDGTWNTVPSVFRDYTDDAGNSYFEKFESIYKEIHNKYPDRISYIEFPVVNISNRFDKIMQDRGQQLALLQHYELYTALLDITSNPYIALLFMTNGKLNKPQLEFYDVSRTPLFMEPENTSLNNRIKVQKGAFLNYELLMSMIQPNLSVLDELKNGNRSFKIPRIVLRIEYLKDSTVSEINNEVRKAEDFKDKFNDNDELKKLVEDTSIPSFDIEQNKKDVYNDVLKHLRQKLNEFQYFENDLFPDFEDFLKNKMKRFKTHE